MQSIPIPKAKKVNKLSPDSPKESLLSSGILFTHSQKTKRETESLLREKEQDFSDQRVKTKLLSSVTVIKTVMYYLKTKMYDIHQICREFMFQSHDLVSSNCLLCDNKLIFHQYT